MKASKQFPNLDSPKSKKPRKKEPLLVRDESAALKLWKLVRAKYSDGRLVAYRVMLGKLAKENHWTRLAQTLSKL